MSTEGRVGVGIIGLGFMGRVHLRSYEAAREAGFNCQLVAVCDVNPQLRSGDTGAEGNIAGDGASGLLFDPAQVHVCSESDELLADANVDLVSVCTYTETHADLTIAALTAGKHVLVEKPVAIASKDVDRVVKAADAGSQLCMPGMCMRFWPGWSWLRDAIDRGVYGPVRSAVFQRLSAPPDWATDFYLDQTRSGGALFDLHIHDADFVRWCFGDPEEVVSTGSTEHLTTLYRFAGGPGHVVAEGGWVPVSGFPLQMRYRVVFDQAEADFDSSRDPQLKLLAPGKSQAVPLDPALTGYDEEIRHILDTISGKSRNLRATLADAANVSRLLEAEHRSLKRGTAIRL